MEQENSELSSQGRIMTDRQIRDVVTPYEFGVSEHLIGTALARPLRRGVALLIDLVLVVLLTDLPSILLAGLGAVFFWRAGKKNEKSPRFAWLRKTMKLIAAVILFGVLAALFTGVNEFQHSGMLDDDSEETILTGSQGLELAAILLATTSQLDDLEENIATKQCVPYDCWEQFISGFSEDFSDTSLSPKVKAEVIKTIKENMEKSLSSEQSAVLLDKLNASLMIPAEIDEKPDPLNAPLAVIPETKKGRSIPVNEDGDPSLLAWARGLLEDLGIGFGWAALYFTALTYWMHGQTPGKKLLGIKVIKLDGSTMTLWESFERYGGYGAGLATGLLGFLQIFWEPNRQAIHDKISETLVVHLGLNKVDVTEVTGDKPISTE